MRTAAQAPAPGAQPQEDQNAAWRKWADAGTVGSLIGFLATLDQDAPIVTAYHVTMPSGERRCKTHSLTISRERVDHATATIRSSDTALPYTHVIWAQPRDETQGPAVGAPAALRGQLNALKAQMTTYPWSSGSALLLLDEIISGLAEPRAVSDAEVMAWVERHDFGASLQVGDYRAMVEDARTIELSADASQPPVQPIDSERTA